MNEFIVGKMGEVLAFARHGRDTLEKGEEGFLEIIDQDEMDEISQSFSELEGKLMNLAEEQEVLEDIEEAAEETLEKINTTRDSYIEEKWDSATALLEWMGFFTGAALLHWHLVAGAAGSVEFDELKKVSADAIDFYENLFASDGEILEDIGASYV